MLNIDDGHTGTRGRREGNDQNIGDGKENLERTEPTSVPVHLVYKFAVVNVIVLRVIVVLVCTCCQRSLVLNTQKDPSNRGET